MRIPVVVMICAFVCPAPAQVRQFPFTENFDTVPVPVLPAGWLTTYGRSSSGDFTTTRSVPHSDSNAVVSTNATLSQSLTSPLFDLSGHEADSVTFFERRSSSHNSGLLIEASADGGGTFPYRIGDTLKNPGTTSYVRRALPLPGALGGAPSVRIRWRIVGDGSGPTGTIRFDDVTLSAKSAVDAELRTLAFEPPSVRAGDSIAASATVANAGIAALPGFTVTFYSDANSDSTPQEDERTGSVSHHAPLPPDDSANVASGLRILPPGINTIIAVVSAAGDQNPLNDTLRAKVAAGYPPSCVVINEIMYDPVTGSSEYVELVNRVMQPVDLRDWILTDASASRSGGRILSRSATVLGPGEYLVVASDSSLFGRFPYLSGPGYNVVIRPGAFSLNNSGDDVILADFARNTIDSVHYLPDWHNQEIDDASGRSLERINPDFSGNDRRNWGTCADPLGGTPGKRNSLYAAPLASPASISCNPNPFSPDGDGVQDVTIVNYRIPVRAGVIRIRIYDSRGRRVRTLADGDVSGSGGEAVWDGFDDERRRVRMGIYIILLEARGAGGEIIQSVKGTVVVAAKL